MNPVTYKPEETKFVVGATLSIQGEFRQDVSSASYSWEWSSIPFGEIVASPSGVKVKFFYRKDEGSNTLIPFETSFRLPWVSSQVLERLIREHVSRRYNIG